MVLCIRTISAATSDPKQPVSSVSSNKSETSVQELEITANSDEVHKFSSMIFSHTYHLLISF